METTAVGSASARRSLNIGPPTTMVTRALPVSSGSSAPVALEPMLRNFVANSQSAAPLPPVRLPPASSSEEVQDLTSSDDATRNLSFPLDQQNDILRMPDSGYLGILAGSLELDCLGQGDHAAAAIAARSSHPHHPGTAQNQGFEDSAEAESAAAAKTLHTLFFSQLPNDDAPGRFLGQTEIAPLEHLRNGSRGETPLHAAHAALGNLRSPYSDLFPSATHNLGSGNGRTNSRAATTVGDRHAADGRWIKPGKGRQAPAPTPAGSLAWADRASGRAQIYGDGASALLDDGVEALSQLSQSRATEGGFHPAGEPSQGGAVRGPPNVHRTDVDAADAAVSVPGRSTYPPGFSEHRSVHGAAEDGGAAASRSPGAGPRALPRRERARAATAAAVAAAADGAGSSASSETEEVAPRTGRARGGTEVAAACGEKRRRGRPRKQANDEEGTPSTGNIKGIYKVVYKTANTVWRVNINDGVQNKVRRRGGVNAGSRLHCITLLKSREWGNEDMGMSHSVCQGALRALPSRTPFHLQYIGTFATEQAAIEAHDRAVYHALGTAGYSQMLRPPAPDHTGPLPAYWFLDLTAGSTRTSNRRPQFQSSASGFHAAASAHPQMGTHQALLHGADYSLHHFAGHAPPGPVRSHSLMPQHPSATLQGLNAAGFGLIGPGAGFVLSASEHGRSPGPYAMPFAPGMMGVPGLMVGTSNRPFMSAPLGPTAHAPDALKGGALLRHPPSPALVSLAASAPEIHHAVSTEAVANKAVPPAVPASIPACAAAPTPASLFLAAAAAAAAASVPRVVSKPPPAANSGGTGAGTATAAAGSHPGTLNRQMTPGAANTTAFAAPPQSSTPTTNQGVGGASNAATVASTSAPVPAYPTLAPPTSAP